MIDCIRWFKQVLKYSTNYSSLSSLDFICSSCQLLTDKFLNLRILCLSSECTFFQSRNQREFLLDLHTVLYVETCESRIVT